MLTNMLCAQGPVIEWQKCYGGSGGDYAWSVEVTPDGGYILAGYNGSNDGDITGWHGTWDFWVIKIDAAGNIQWQKSLGGSNWDFGHVIHQTADGGYIVGGSSVSIDGDIVGNKGAMDYWVVKLDKNGNIQWRRNYGGSLNDYLYGLQITSDGGYLLAGLTESNDGDVSGNHGKRDFWVLKIDATGNIQWQKCYGGSEDEEAYSLAVAADGGYVVAGYTMSNDGDVNGNHGAGDCWLIKLNSAGVLQWQKCFGSSAYDQAWSVQKTTDGGFIFAGFTSGNDGNVSGSHGDADDWVVKLDAAGNIQWQKCYGGSFNEQAYAIELTPDGGYVIAGFAESLDGQVTCHVEYHDYWVVKINSTGDLEWEKIMGGNNTDEAYAVKPTPDGGYIVAGVAVSTDIPGYHPIHQPSLSAGDFWIIKLSANLLTPTIPTISINTPSLTICSGTNVKFTATTNIAGDHPSYTWQKNGVQVGTNTDTYAASDIADGDVITCTFNTTEYCVPYSASSNSLTMSVSNTVPPTISISSNVVSVCAGIDITFFATVANGHGSPLFQWKLNGADVGTNSATYSGNTFKDGDFVSCTFTDNSPCTAGGINSNIIQVRVASPVDPALSISTGSTNICTGTLATFTANPTNASGSPTYQWRVNGIDVGTNSTTFSSSTLVNGDVVDCVLTSDPALTCIVHPVTLSNDIVMTVTNAVSPSITIAASDNDVCSGTNINFTATADNAGTSPSYQWKINGSITGNNNPVFTSSTLKNGDNISCTLLPGTNACSVQSLNSNIVAIGIKDLPVINISPADTIVKRGSVVQMNAIISGDIGSYQWSPSTVLTDPMSLTPTTIPLTENTLLTLNATGVNGCTASKTSNIKMSGPLYMPNAFTPNGDGKNDVFRIPPDVTILLTEFSIYDRWGNKVFSTRNISQGWNGMFGGDYANAGVYVYVISGSNEKGNFTAKGSFVLIR
ncbi:MAG: gliding motility-associated C-terminal domain-containing protein [Bacteroidetes bacterium]|nr:gliding motility-associated C-terminal domain-containing protein [Bacteroidota bacterium]